jgi:hypothetical protein
MFSNIELPSGSLNDYYYKDGILKIKATEKYINAKIYIFDKIKKEKNEIENVFLSNDKIKLNLVVGNLVKNSLRYKLIVEIENEIIASSNYFSILETEKSQKLDEIISDNEYEFIMLVDLYGNQIEHIFNKFNNPIPIDRQMTNFRIIYKNKNNNKIITRNISLE